MSDDSDFRPALPPRHLLLGVGKAPPPPPPLPEPPRTLPKQQPMKHNTTLKSQLNVHGQGPGKSDSQIPGGSSMRHPRDRSAERMRKFLPHQANLFNDMIQPELRRILSQRKSKNEPVEV